MDKLKAMQYFCRIDETGRFSAAARLAGVPESRYHPLAGLLSGSGEDPLLVTDCAGDRVGEFAQ